jgi:tRNA-dihydrouridine synthase B
MITIGNYKPKNKFFLAPMEEINDIAFRKLCKKAGCGLTYTGMINPLTKQKIILDDKPALQLFCTETKGIKEFIKKYEKKVALFDFNLGCPAKTARKHGFGVFLHHDMKKIEEILRTMRKATKKPITIKLRQSKYALKIAKMAEKYVDAIGIHPRTQKQGYGGEPDISFARKIKSQTKLPVIYSGNADETNSNELLKEFDFVMLGRKTIGNPNIFTSLLHNLRYTERCKGIQNKKPKITFKHYLKLAEKYKLPFRQIKIQAMNFTKGLHGARELRLKIFETRKINEIKNIDF